MVWRRAGDVDRGLCDNEGKILWALTLPGGQAQARQSGRPKTCVWKFLKRPMFLPK